MTLPHENDLALINTRKILWAVLVGDKESLELYAQQPIRVIPKWLRVIARTALKHYPSEWEIKDLKPFQKAKES